MPEKIILGWPFQEYDKGDTMEKVTHRITNINVDIHAAIVYVSVEHKLKTEFISIPLSQALECGFINIEALKPMIK